MDDAGKRIKGLQAAPGHRRPRTDAAHRDPFRRRAGSRRRGAGPRPDHPALSSLERFFADDGYQGPRVSAAAPRPVKIIKRSDTGFVVQSRRWVIERTFARAFINHRLAREVERAVETVRAIFQVAMIKLMARRITRYRDF